MKKIITIIAVLLFVSCSSNNTDIEDIEDLENQDITLDDIKEKIQGSWKSDYFLRNNSQELHQYWNQVTTSFGENKPYSKIIEFKEDSIFYSTTIPLINSISEIKAKSKGIFKLKISNDSIFINKTYNIYFYTNDVWQKNGGVVTESHYLFLKKINSSNDFIYNFIGNTSNDFYIKD
jgi:hypothetical protein